MCMRVSRGVNEGGMQGANSRHTFMESRTVTNHSAPNYMLIAEPSTTKDQFCAPKYLPKDQGH